jgi:general secretion pathway protein A
MYQKYFGLTSLPFDLTTDLRFLFMTPRHREALSTLEYGVSASKGLVLLIGEAGTGKTTIIRAFLASRPGDAHRFIYLDNPTLTRSEFYELLARRMDLSPAAGASKAQFLVEMESATAARRQAGGCVVLIIDEAQALPLEFLEEVRLLTNLETEREKLISIVLSGQQEIADRLEEPAFRSLKQRVVLRCELTPLDLDETARYIAGRIRIAGGNPARIFTRDAVVAAHEHSRGIPRTIGVICDNALLSGFARDVRPVGADIVAEVCRDFRLERQSYLSVAAGAAAPAATPRTDLRDAPEIARGDTPLARFLSHVRHLAARPGRVITLGASPVQVPRETDETIEN